MKVCPTQMIQPLPPCGWQKLGKEYRMHSRLVVFLRNRDTLWSQWGSFPAWRQKIFLWIVLFERFAAEIPTPLGKTRSSFGNDLVTTERAAQLLGVTTDDIDHAGFSMDEAFVQAHLYYSTEL